MKDLVIHYLFSSNRHGIFQQFQKLYVNDAITWVDIRSEKLDWSKIEVFLILEPVCIEKNDYSISYLWKNWLLDHAPHVNLIVAAFTASLHPNFLNLADLPKSLYSWLSTQSFSVNEYRLELAGVDYEYGVKRDVFIDPWLRHLPLTGNDMVTVMTGFIKGHDKTNSFFDQLVNLRKDLRDLAYWSGKDKPDENRISTIADRLYYEWLGLRSRWMHYNPFMNVLPFVEAANEIEKLLGVAHEKTRDFENPLTPDNQKVLIKLNDEIFKKIYLLLEREFMPYIYRNRNVLVY